MIEKINEIERAIECGYYYSALALALSIPDICGQVYCPNLAGTKNSGKRYRKWFDDYVARYYFKDSVKYPNGSDVAFNGFACYLLRCAYLHSGNYDLKAQDDSIKIKEFRIHYSKPDHTFGHYEVVLTNTGDFILDIDAKYICGAICLAAKSFYDKTTDKSQFKDSLITMIE